MRYCDAKKKKNAETEMGAQTVKKKLHKKPRSTISHHLTIFFSCTGSPLIYVGHKTFYYNSNDKKKKKMVQYSFSTNLYLAWE